MKLIIREYLASLKEREELDAILPDLLTELGFTVFSRPGRGTAQSGVDVAAVGPDGEGGRKVFLLAIKRGDLTRQDWDGSPQALRPTLNEIQEVYIRSKLPSWYKELKIAICICLGGDVKEPVRLHLTGYEERHTTEQISFEEWTGDEIAEMLLRGVLREEVLPKELRSIFRKSVAMVDEPDVAFRHFAALVQKVVTDAQVSQVARVRASRLIYLCVWILFVWARDIDNVEAPYRASELALLRVWGLLRPLIGKKNKNARAINAVFSRLLMLHLIVVQDLLDRKVLPYTSRRYALSMAVQSRSAADANLKLFDLLGRIAMAGLWHHWLASLEHVEGNTERRRASEKEEGSARESAEELAKAGLELIQNNPALFLPLCDDQAIDVTLFLLLSVAVKVDGGFMASWLGEMARRLRFTVVTHGRYPCTFSDYREIEAHPREQSDEYRQSAIVGSILIPLLAAWLAALGESEEYAVLSELKQNELSHCTLQLWLPDEESEEGIYSGGRDHGVGLLDLPLTGNGDELLETIADACEKESAFGRLSAVQTGNWPVVLLACRHHRYPVPPQFWVNMLRATQPGTAEVKPEQGGVVAENGVSGASEGEAFSSSGKG